MKAIVRKRQQRLITEPAKPGYVFELRGQPVHEEKIKRFMTREEIPVDAVYSPSSGAPTPADTNIECWTPKASLGCDLPIILQP